MPNQAPDTQHGMLSPTCALPGALNLFASEIAQPTLHPERHRLLFLLMLPASSDSQALQRAVLCAPDDDAPRLIFADYLDEHGESARATLIRRMIAAPTYTFFWSRRCKWPRHIHSEPIRAIRGLLGEVWPVCEREWDRWPEVESIIYRRGFAEGVVMRSFNFLRLAIQFFPLHPIQDVLLWDLPPVHISERRGWTRAALVRDGFGAGHWPAVLFSEYSHRRELVYEGGSEARADLYRHACAYGRRLAMVRVEPPPVPARQAELRVVPFGKVGGEGEGQ